MADKTIVVRIALKAGGLTSGLGQASSAVRGFGADVSRAAGGAASSAQALGLTSAAMGKLIVLGIGGAMAVSAKAAIDFESTLAGVAKTTDLAGEAFDKANTPLAVFGEAIRNLALRIPVNVNDLNKIAELGGQLGIEVPNLISFTDTIARLAVSTNLTIEEAATGLARIANIMRTPQTEFERLGSVVVELGNNFATTEGEILSFSLRIAPVAAALGSSEEAVFGLSAALTSLGIPAERGGTAVQRVLTSIAQAVSAGGEQLEMWADVAGVSVDEFTQAFRDEPIQAFNLFVRGLNDINEAGGSVFGTLNQLEIQEQRTIQVLLAAAGGYRILEDALVTAAREGEEVNALQEESARRFGTTASQLQLLSNSFNDLRIEIGGAILGSGGIAAAIDVLREFFSIVVDNIDSLASMAQGLALIAGVRILLGFGGLINKARMAAIELRGLATTAGVAATSTSRLQLAMALSNVALGAAVLGIGILMTAWANAAIEAAQLRGRVRALNDEIEAGADVIDTYVQSLIDANILTHDRRQLLLNIAEGEESFVEQLLAGKSAFDLLSPAMRSLAEDTFGLDESLEAGSKGMLQLQRAAGTGGAAADLFAFVQLVRQAREDLEKFRDVKVIDLTNSMYESGVAVGKTREEMEELANEAIDLFGIGVSEETFTAWATGALAAMGHVTEGMREAQANLFGRGRGFSFIDALMGRGEEGEAQLDDWTDSIVGSVEDMNDRLAEQFEDIRSTMLGGMPTSADYEQVAALTKDGLNKIIAAQDLYIIDLMDAVNASNSLIGRFSQQTQDWFATLDVPTQAAFGRLDAAAFDAFFAEVEANFGEVGTIFESRITALLPEAMKKGFGGVLAVITSESDKLGLSGEQTVDAYVTGIETAMSGLSIQGLDDDFMAFLSGIFGSEEQARAAGFDTMLPWVQGMIAALGTLSERAGPVITREIGDVNDKFNSEAQITSPSRLTYYTGEMMAKGLIVGLEDTLRGWNPTLIKTEFQPKIDSLVQPVVNLQTMAPQKHVSIKIDHAEPGPVARDLQTAGIVGNVLANT